MKKILTALLFMTFLLGMFVAAEGREVKGQASLAKSSVSSSMLQRRRGRRRWRRRRWGRREGRRRGRRHDRM